jgi:DinB superfamily
MEYMLFLLFFVYNRNACKFKKTFIMKYLLVAIMVFASFFTQAQTDSTPSLKSILLEQLHTTHDIKDWFVPANIAVADLTPDQANWKDNSGNHSIAMLTTHLIFWNKQSLDKFKGIKPDAFSGNNKETFTPVNASTWPAAVKELDHIMQEWEMVVQNASDDQLKKWYSTIAHIGTHNAYHIGQILYIRKMKGWWKDDNGVK